MGPGIIARECNAGRPRTRPSGGGSPQLEVESCQGLVVQRQCPEARATVESRRSQPMGKPRSKTTFRDDQGSSWSKTGHYATELSGGARTVVAHGATPEESQLRATRLWEARDRQIAEAAEHGSDEGLRVAFEELVLSWSSATAHLSSPTKLVEHPAYRQIIGLGPAVLPLMLRDLAENGRFWFPALNAITGENPVADDTAGDIERMTEAWIRWGHANGLI